jgi:HEAT repeat protein
LFALQALGPQAEEAVPALIPLLRSPDAWVAEFAAHALSATGLASVTGIPLLADVVCNSSLPVAQRLACSNALASIGPPAQSAVPRLLKVVEQPEPVSPPVGEVTEWQLRAAIIHALGRIGGEDKRLIEIVHSQLSSRSSDVRAASADALGRVAKQSPEVLKDLIRRLRDDDAGVRAMAAQAIGRMECDRTTAVTPLVDALSNERHEVCVAAAMALGRIGPTAKSALPALRETLADRKHRPSGGQRPHWWNDDPEFTSVDFDKALRTAIAEIDEEPDAGNEPETSRATKE